MIKNAAAMGCREDDPDTRCCRALFKAIICRAARDLCRLRTSMDLLAAMGTPVTKQQKADVALLMKRVRDGIDAQEFFADWRLSAYCHLAGVNAGVIRRAAGMIGKEGIEDGDFMDGQYSVGPTNEDRSSNKSGRSLAQMGVDTPGPL